MHLRAVDGDLRNTPVRWGGAAALLASYATETAPVNKNNGEEDDEDEDEEEADQSSRQLHWDGTDKDESEIARETNAHVDRRAGVVTKGGLSTAVFTTIVGGKNKATEEGEEGEGDEEDNDDSDDDDDDVNDGEDGESSSSSEDDDDEDCSDAEEKLAKKKEKMRKAAKKRKKKLKQKRERVVCGVLELVNCRRPNGTFSAKDRAIAAIVADEVGAGERTSVLYYFFLSWMSRCFHHFSFSLSSFFVVVAPLSHHRLPPLHPPTFFALGA